jgi:hypothetical protein
MSALLAIAPLLFLVAALLCGRYPGAEVLDRLRSGRRPHPASRSAPRVRLPVRHRPARPRGAALIAFSLAGRAPPLPPVATATERQL